MYTLGQWAKDNDYYDIELFQGKKFQWLKFKQDCGLLTFKLKRKVHYCDPDSWIVERIKGREVYVYIRYFSFDKVKRYDFFEEE